MSGDKPYAVVYKAFTELDATLRQAVLEAQEIPVMIMPIGRAMSRGYLGYLGTKPVAKLIVPTAYAKRARRLLAEYDSQVEAGAFELEEDEE